MRKIFSMDNPYMQFMGNVFDYCLINFITAFFSLPIITLGAAVTASHKVMQDRLMDNEQPVLRSYFRSFFGNFKQATIVWLIVLLVIALLAADVIIVIVYCHELLAMLICIFLGSVTAVVLGTAIYAFALIARYENTLKQHLRNSMLLSLGQLPKTILLLLICALPILFAFISLPAAMLVLSFFGFSLTTNFQTRLLKPVFTRLEGNDQKGPDIANEQAELALQEELP